MALDSHPAPVMAPSVEELDMPVVSVMSAQLTERDTRTVLDEDIASLDLASIAFLTLRNERWTVEKVDAIELEYRCYLQCLRDYPEEALVPGRDCDLFWHQHLLHNALYNEQMQRLFGRIVAHFPFAGLRGEDDAALQQVRSDRSRRIIGGLLERVRHNLEINVLTESST